MFLNKYLNSTYLELLYDNYEEFYINSLDEEDFNKIYILLKNYHFYYIEDIILDYLELFTLDEKNVQHAIEVMRLTLGENFVKQIGNDMTLLDKIIELASSYEEI